MAAAAENGIGSANQFVRLSPHPIATGPSSTSSVTSSLENETEYQRDVRKFVDLLSKLNPSAKEFFPSSYPAPAVGSAASGGAAAAQRKSDGRLSADAPVFVASTDYYNNVYSNQSNNNDSSSDGSTNNHQLNRRRRNGFNQGRRRMNERMMRAEREDSIRRTVYVSDIDIHVTEEHLAELFASCGQRTMDTPGPISAEVLYAQATHRSSHTRYGQDANITVTEHARSHSKWVLDHRAAVYIQASKLYTCSKMSWVRLDWSLITALVDRWRSETSTFHMRHGEMTITLQDVAIITGLPVNGLPILWSDPPNNWEPVMQELLGVAHPNIDRGKIPYKWLRDTFSPLPELATDLQIQEYARAYILHMIGTLLFPDPSKGKVHLRWLVKLENFDEIGNLSWGSAVLAHLYDELNKVALMQTKGIYACATLLQVWSWERLPLGRPVLRQQRLTGTDPLGYKWTGKRTCPTPQRNPELPPSWG